eukprot:gene42401-66124_t
MHVTVVDDVCAPPPPAPPPRAATPHNVTTAADVVAEGRAAHVAAEEQKGAGSTKVRSVLFKLQSASSCWGCPPLADGRSERRAS